MRVQFAKPLMVVTTALTLLAVSPLASAERVSSYGYANNPVRYDYARVVSATPIVRQVTVETPVRECYTEHVERHYGPRHGVANNPGRALVGAVIGGVIGNQFGSGRGNDAATVAGTLIGAAVGANGGERRGRTVETVPVERCDIRYESRIEERIEGYDVRYVYNGQTLATRTEFDPGNQIRVRVTVQPTR
ncbi:MAG: glycine zipper 2TM domain-containing protein [Pseudomonadota bacterium]